MSAGTGDVDKLCRGTVGADRLADSDAVYAVGGDAEDVNIGELSGENVPVKLTGIAEDFKDDVFMPGLGKPFPDYGLCPGYIVFLVVAEDNGKFISHCFQ